MTKRMRCGVIAGVATLLLASPASAQNFGSKAFKCQLDLWKAFKVSLFVEKFAGKCAIDYQKRDLFLLGEKGKDPSALDKSGELCEKFVGDKALDIVSTALATGNCDDSNYRALGHFPEGPTSGSSLGVGSAANGQLAVLDALRAGLRRAAEGAPEFWTIMDVVANDVGAGSECTVCETLRNALFQRGVGPCATHVCRLDEGSSSIDLVSSAGTLPVSVSGDLSFDICRWDPAFPNAFGVFGGPARTISAVALGTPVCVETAQTRGFIVDAGSSLNVRDVEVCQDHVVSGTCSVTTISVCGDDADCPSTETCIINDPNECITTDGYGGEDCADEGFEGNCSSTTDRFCQTDDECPGAETCDFTTPQVTGGACARLTDAGATSPGDAMIATTLVNTPALDPGVDGIPCTSDDGDDPGAPVTVVLTTAAATGTIHDENRVDGVTNTTPAANGAPFDLAALEAGPGGLSSAALVSAFPALSTNLLPVGASSDFITSVSLVCEP